MANRDLVSYLTANITVTKNKPHPLILGYGEDLERKVFLQNRLKLYSHAQPLQSKTH